MVDVIIVGQGIAGTLLAYFLKEKGLRVKIIDDNHKTSSSKVAAGIINPVTGRRYTKSWMIDKLLPCAKTTYHQLEKLLNVNIVSERNIIRTLPDVRSENNWMSRMGQEGYDEYFSAYPSLGLFENMIHPPFSYGNVNKSLQIDFAILMDHFRSKYSRDFINERFDFEKLKISSNERRVQYGPLVSSKIVFCEGYMGKENLLFDYLPFEGAKGEVLIIHIPGFNAQKILRHQVFLAPLGQERYWVGAGYSWDLTDTSPTGEEKERLKQLLDKILKVPFTIEKHMAGVRPATKDRRPFLGRHPGHDNAFIFNGLGTKGASLGPYWASTMAEYMVGGRHLEEEVDIMRYNHLHGG